jgi:hypothetical protein
MERKHKLLDYIIAQQEIKFDQFRTCRLNEDGEFKDQQISILLDSVLSILIEICGTNSTAINNVAETLGLACYYAKLCVKGNNKNCSKEP